MQSMDREEIDNGVMQMEVSLENCHLLLEEAFAEWQISCNVVSYNSTFTAERLLRDNTLVWFTLQFLPPEGFETLWSAHYGYGECEDMTRYDMPAVGRSGPLFTFEQLKSFMNGFAGMLGGYGPIVTSTVLDMPVTKANALQYLPGVMYEWNVRFEYDGMSAELTHQDGRSTRIYFQEDNPVTFRGLLRAASALGSSDV